MKEKIKSALKTKYASLGLSEEALDGAALLMSITITEESQIEAVVNGAEPSLKGFQADVDRRVTAISGKNQELEAENLKLKGTPPTPTPPAGTPPVAGGTDNQTLELIKGLQETVKGLQDANVQDKMSKNNNELMASAKAKMVAKGMDQSSCDKILGTINIAEGETVDTLYEKGITEYNGFKQMFAPEGITPFKPQSPDGKDAIESFMDRKAAEKKEHFENI